MVNEVWTMVSTTNERFKYLEGTTGILQYSFVQNVYWFNYLHTSQVDKIKRTKKTITVTTLNSVYKFKRINK